jgi:CRP/FNR family transcriptional regulator
MLTIDEGMLRVLGNVSLFTGLDRVHLIWLLSAAERVNCKQDELFFDEGDVGDKFFVFIKGASAVEKRSGDGWSKIVDLRPGDTFGEMAIIDGAPRSARVRAMSDSIALCLPQRRLEASPEVAAVVYRNIARMQAARVRDANEKLFAK